MAFTAEQQRSHTRTQRARAIAALGGKCRRCGFSDYRALQIDHRHSNGRLERRSLKDNKIAFYKLVLANAHDYQCLCANCNWIKRDEEHEYMAEKYRSLWDGKNRKSH